MFPWCHPLWSEKQGTVKLFVDEVDEVSFSYSAVDEIDEVSFS